MTPEVHWYIHRQVNQPNGGLWAYLLPLVSVGPGGSTVSFDSLQFVQGGKGPQKIHFRVDPRQRTILRCATVGFGGGRATGSLPGGPIRMIHLPWSRRPLGAPRAPSAPPGPGETQQNIGLYPDQELLYETLIPPPHTQRHTHTHTARYNTHTASAHNQFQA